MGVIDVVFVNNYIVDRLGDTRVCYWYCCLLLSLYRIVGTVEYCVHVVFGVLFVLNHAHS